MESIAVLMLLFLGGTVLLVYALHQERGSEETVDRSEALRRAHARSRRRDGGRSGGDEDPEPDPSDAVRDR